MSRRSCLSIAELQKRAKHRWTELPTGLLKYKCVLFFCVVRDLAQSWCHVQVVAALNPIAGEKMQEELEQRISALQNELETAHTEVRCSCCCALSFHMPFLFSQRGR